jgi:2,4-dienoyl-CoA reductase-like NADH-dependent reductase (Old Yellow Enzyme family)
VAQLFTPFHIGNLELRNRIVISPMCQYSAQDGEANSWHLMHLGHLSHSGAGLLFIEATAVEARGRITPGDLGLWNDSTQIALHNVLSEVRKYSDIKIGLQIAHAGRKASTRSPWENGSQISIADGGWQTVAPSPVAFLETEAQPQALDAKGMQQVRDAFAAAAKRADQVGVDVIEVHAAHGYLLHEFLSPLSNFRQDTYGGDFNARVRFPLEVFDAVRAAVSAHKPVGIRISATDWVEGGWDLNQSVEFIRLLKQRGCAFVDVSSGSLSLRQQIPVGPSYQVPLAERIKADAGIPTIAVGLITEPKQADHIITSGQADLVAFARAMLYNPRWPWHAAAALNAQVDVPPQYWRAAPAEFKHLFRK